jgi:hypothetical protein
MLQRSKWSLALCCTPVISVLRRLRENNDEFEARVDYIVRSRERERNPLKETVRGLCGKGKFLV